MAIGTVIYVKVPDSAIQRGFVTCEEMAMTTEQFKALVRAGFCIKPIISSAMNRLDMEPEITPTLAGNDFGDLYQAHLKNAPHFIARVERITPQSE